MATGAAWITGIGVHSALGGAEEVWRALLADQSGVGMHGLPGIEDFPAVPSAPVIDAAPVRYVHDRKLIKYMNLATQLAVSAAGRAMESATLVQDALACANTALFVATGLTAFDFTSVAGALSASKGIDGELDLKRLGTEGFDRCNPLMPFRTLLNMPLGMVSIALGIRGENAIYYPGVDQAGVCLETALRGIRNGRFSRALAGASVHAHSLMPLCALRRLGRLASSPERARPFRPDHEGYAPADAAGFVVLESRDGASLRGAKPLATLEGVITGRSARGTQADRIARRSSQWRSLTGDERPDLVLCAGGLAREDDQVDEESSTRLWGTQPPRLSTLDGHLGYQGVASLPCAVAIAARMLLEGRVPGSLLAIANEPIRRILISASDPDGGFAAALVARHGDLRCDA